LLNPDALDKLEAGYVALGSAGADLFDRAVDAMQLAMADAVGLVFVASTFVTFTGFIVSFFMPEPSYPLRQPEPEGKITPQSETGRLEGEPAS